MNHKQSRFNYIVSMLYDQNFEVEYFMEIINFFYLILLMIKLNNYEYFTDCFIF